MKICRIILDGEIRNAVSSSGSLLTLPPEWKIGDPIEPASPVREIDPKEASFLSPFEPGKIVCVGRNYAGHAKELGNEVPKEPLLFLKAPTALITEGEEIVLPESSTQVEHEGELGVVIGRDCRRLAPQDDPLEYVLGYVCVNDVTARDLQKTDVQFTRAKSFDTFCPVSRFIETSVDAKDLRVRVIVNGETRQDGRTSQMIFDIPRLIRYISDHMTLKAGDLLITGTPSGVGPLSSGDVCEVIVEGVGRVSNPVVSQKDTGPEHQIRRTTTINKSI